MFGILIVTHGQMAEGVIDALKMIMGENEWPAADSIQPVILKEGESPETLIDEIDKRIRKMRESSIRGALILTDLYGSSTTNAAVKKMLSSRSDKSSREFGIAVVSGLNLPMVLELVPALKDAESIEELTNLAVNTGRKGIVNLTDELNKRKKNADHDQD
jgi:mannose/fructose-specific phosphotransferase system component IIA